MSDVLSARASLSEARNLFTTMRRAAGNKLYIALGMLMLSSLSEGISVLLLLPILSLVSRSEEGAPIIEITEREFMGVTIPAFTLPLAVLLSMLVCFLILQALFNRMRTVYVTDIQLRFSAILRHGLFSAIAESRWDHLVRQRNADLEHALVGEVERVRMASMLLMSLIQGSASLVLYVALGLMISVPMTVLSAVFGVVAFLALRPYRKMSAEYGVKLQGLRRDQFRAVSGFLSGLKTAKAMNLEEAEIAGFDAILDMERTDTREFARRTATGSGIFQIAQAIGAVIFIYLSLVQLGLAISEIVVLLLVMMRLAPRFMTLQQQAQMFLVNLPGWQHIRNVQGEMIRQRDVAAGLPIATRAPWHEIRLENVSYRHGEGLPRALEDVSLSVRAGEVTALIGPSGSGKSTIADLICGLIRPETGKILIDGQDLDPMDIRSWRHRISYVTQDTYLPPMTVREALQVGAPDADQQDMEAALRVASADFVFSLPAQLDTLLGERGVLLSGGERQRIALARALLRKPELLILDEATSALDWQSQNRIVANLAKIETPMAILTIAHRYSMVEFADMVFALEDGRIVESGAPAILRTKPDARFMKMRDAERSTSRAV